jgi:hypothetical protein
MERAGSGAASRDARAPATLLEPHATLASCADLATFPWKQNVFSKSYLPFDANRQKRFSSFVSIKNNTQERLVKRFPNSVDMLSACH